MKVKRIVADNMQQALRQVSQILGPDAVIVSSKKLEKGIEVVAALDLEDHADPAQQQEMDRQVNLQRELDQARRELQGASNPAAREAREEYVRQSDLSSPAGIREALAGLKEGIPADTQPAAQRSAPSVQAQPQNLQPQPAVTAQPGAGFESLEDMRGELRELKNWLVSHQGSAWDTSRPLTWQQSQLWQRCQDMGLEPAWADRVVTACGSEGKMQDAWSDALAHIRADLPIAASGLLEQGGHYVLVGPTGAGKTTTLGKIAARFVLAHGPESVALLTLDNYRVAAHDQLRTFARILGVEMKIVQQGGDLAKAYEEVSNRKLVLIDSAGLSSQDPHFSEQLSMLKQVGKSLKKLLVLPLTSQARCLQENYEHFRPAGLDGCVFTKLDECFSLGAAMSVAALTRLPVTLVTNGPHIPDDLHYPDGQHLVKMAEQMACLARTRWQAAEAMNMATQQTSFQQGV